MAKIPTVKLRNRKTGRTAKVDATTYARDISAWSQGWEIIGTQHGDATDEQVLDHKAAVDLEHERNNDPIREKWSNDKQRVRDQNRVTTGGLVIKAPITKAVGRPANYRPPSLG
mgnify:CR=1 FL=1|jgi:hypothetical protein